MTENTKTEDRSGGGGGEGGLWAPGFPFRPERTPVFYGWVIVVASAVGMLASMPGQTMGFSVFIETLMSELGLTRNGLSLAYLAGTLTSGLLLPWGGTVFDRLGARRMMVLASTGLGLVCLYFSAIDRIAAGLAGIGGWAASALTSWTVAMLGFFLIRFTGQGMMSMTARSMLGKWFHHRRGIAQSTSGVVVSFGFSMTPLLLGLLLDRVGWRGSYLALALGCGFAVALFAWLFYRDNPEECGLKMDGGFVPREGKPRTEDLVVHRDFTRTEALRTFAFWAFNLTFCVHAFWFTGYTFHIVSIGEQVGVGGREILAFFLPATAVSIPSNFFLGWLSDRTRLKYLLALMSLSMGLAGISYYLLPGIPGKVTLILGMGLTGGGFAALSGIIFPRFFGREHLGAIGGFSMSTNVIASALGPYAFSLVYTTTGSYQSLFLLLLVMSGGLVLASWRADNPQRNLPDREDLGG